MKIKGSIHRKLFLSHFLAVILVSGSIGTYFYFSAYDSLMHNLQLRLLNSAAIIAQTLDAADLHYLRTPEDVRRPEYIRCLNRLRKLRRTNPDIAFLYVMRQSGDRVSFVVDSDETAAQAKPGRPYEDVVPALIQGFRRPSVDQQIYQDEWGAFMSGYAPVPNGNGAYLVGLDMRAGEVKKKFRALNISGMISLVCSILLALMFSRLLSRRFVSGIRLLVSRCKSIADGKLDEQLQFNTHDEFDHLIHAFNRMSEGLAQSKEQTQRAENALIRSNEELELRVKARTRELREVNNRLKTEIEMRKRAQATLAEAARTDPLTGLLNRRAGQEHFDYFAEAYARTRRPFAVLMVDIDHFKPVNDHCGHPAGDAVLQQISNLIKEQVRHQDIVVRWGGEEFMILLPDATLRGGSVVAQKICKRIAGTKLMIAEHRLQITVSIGVACCDGSASPGGCIREADAALYRAKRRGRNRVETADPIPSEPLQPAVGSDGIDYHKVV